MTQKATGRGLSLSRRSGTRSRFRLDGWTLLVEQVGKAGFRGRRAPPVPGWESRRSVRAEDEDAGLRMRSTQRPPSPCKKARNLVRSQHAEGGGFDRCWASESQQGCRLGPTRTGQGVPGAAQTAADFLRHRAPPPLWRRATAKAQGRRGSDRNHPTIAPTSRLRHFSFQDTAAGLPSGVRRRAS